ncbi:leucine-rich repeat domain-containing protein [Mangrovicoccus sp. HB161399]|uniref:leucine-rich repeat domain-containing protein n=1 Tax=Mangrovicoccus sp. HB161399 TaxID=2720392 RepID=UPI00155519F9|nr:leucine-rich repeat domain-containing protein [Mangrovicoccus sp. HB161399]
MQDGTGTAREEALRRIREAEDSGAAELSFFGLKGLDALPTELARLGGLKSLDLGGTGITDIDALAALPGLQIVQLVGTPALRLIQELEPLMDARDLRIFFRDNPPAPAAASVRDNPFGQRGIAARLDTTLPAEWEAARLGLGEERLARIGTALLAETFAAGTRRLAGGLPLFLREIDGLQVLFLASRAPAQALRVTLGGLAPAGESRFGSPEVRAAAEALQAALGHPRAAASAVLPPLVPATADSYPGLSGDIRARHMLNALAQIAAADALLPPDA